MRTSRDGGPRDSHAVARALCLGPTAAELYGDLRLSPLLRRLLDQSGRLLDVAAGSISLVDSTRSRYTKVAEVGASCQLGQTFPLDEGVTGQVASHRRPVVLGRYGDVRGGHLPADHPAQGGAVAAVPIWWLGQVIGANVAFAGRDRAFTAREIDEFELLSQVGAAGIVSAGAAEPSLAHLIRDRAGHEERPHDVPVVVTEAGPARPASPELARTAVELVGLAQREAGRRRPGGRLHVVLIHQPDGLRLLVHDEPGAGHEQGAAPSASSVATWQHLAEARGGGVSVEQVPGWGVLVRADLPYSAAPAEPSALTPREQEVLGLLRQGLTDRQMADALLLSPKTVEKHVGALLRKTGTTGRTAAVMCALERGWLPPVSGPQAT